MTRNGSRMPNPQRSLKTPAGSTPVPQEVVPAEPVRIPLDGVVSRLRGHGDRFGQRRHRVYFFPAHIIGKLRLPSWRTAAYPRAEKAQK